MARFVFPLSLLFGFLLTTPTEAASPRLSIITPRGVERGSEATLRFSGTNLSDAEEVLFYEPGFEVVELKVVDERRVDVKVRVSEEIRLGEHVAQLRCRSGVSDYRTLYVGPFPTVVEKEPNSEFDTPQVVEMGVTVDGRVESEDVDYYLVKAKKGQRLSVEIEAMRLGTRNFDPYIAILDPQRFELDRSDDLPLLHQDGACGVVVPEDGEYRVMVREASYGGDSGSRYRLHIGTFPRPTAVYPAGGKFGTAIDVKFLGDPRGEVTARFELPTESQPDFGLSAIDAEGTSPSVNPFRLSPYDNTLETEPNNDRNTATVAKDPGTAFNGIIGTEGDIDFFQFPAKKGEKFTVRCYARELRSPLDAVMHLYDANGKRLASNDDKNGPDPEFDFNVPADGEYVIRVTDHLGRGDLDFVYRVEVQPKTPQLDISIPRITRYGQERQQIVVPRGGRYATLMTVRRQGFGGDVVLEPQGLPDGITMTADLVKNGLTTVPVLFEAQPDAPIAGRLIPFEVRAPEQKVSGRFRNFADFIRGQNNVILWGKEVNRVPVAVTEEAPFSVEIKQPKVPIIRNGSMALKVKVNRKDGFTKPITLEFPHRPPGIGTTSKVVIPEGKSEGVYPLNANGNAGLGDWKVFVLGTADMGGQVSVSSQLATLTVAEPLLTVQLDRVAVEQGQETVMPATISVGTPFEGEATLELSGLPNKVASDPQKLTKETAEIAFPIRTDAASPAGRHKSVFGQITIVQHGEPIRWRVGTTEVRIDKPLPKPKPKPVASTDQKPKPKPEAKPPEQAKPKPLSRLEQLRLQAKQRREAEAKGE